MRISVEHRTRYSYEHPISNALERLRLTPPLCSWQRVVDWRVDVPGIERALRYSDGFGNAVHLVNVPDGLGEIEIVASGVVETDASGHAVGGVADRVPAAVFLRETAATRSDAAIVELANAARRDAVLDTCHALAHGIHERVAYATGTTDPTTNAYEALARGQGVCQDHAHLFCSAARSLAIPARYVNGYMALDGVAAAHHAWAEALVPDLGWVGFDISNARSPTDIYVRLATGLDAVSAAPVRGVHGGGGAEVLDVRVQVSQQQQQ